jgi:hypothetical protein
MGYYGFGLGTNNGPGKPKKIFGKRTGIFNRNVGDELNSRHDGHRESMDIRKDKTSVTERNRKIFYRELSDDTIKLIAASLVILIVISLILRLWFL